MERETTEEREARHKLIRQLDLAAMVCFVVAALIFIIPAIAMIIAIARSKL